MRTVDLFCGGGGMSLGFQNAGFEVIASFDNWERALNVYRNNFNHPANQIDLSDVEAAIEAITPLNPEVIIGGPPCQDFSSAGKRDETLGRADLTYRYADIVCAIQPNWFVMENVERIKKSHILQDVIEQFSNIGYGMTAVILDASYCGVPQARTRFFLIGEMNGENNALRPIMVNSLTERPMTIRDYLGDSLGVDHYYRHPRNYSRRGVFSIDEPSPTVRGVNRPVPSGYKKHPGDPAHISINKIRPLTTVERSYLQTFPRDFVLNGTKTDLEQIIGNAVPVNLATFVGSSILEYIGQKKPETQSIQEDMFQQEIEKKPIIMPHRRLHLEKN